MDVEHEQTSFHRFEVDDSRPASTTNTDFDPHSPSDIIPLLPPVDRGKDAWLFLAGATTVEVLVWGLPFSVGVLREYWSRELFPTEVYHGDTMLTLAATLQTGLLYMLGVIFGPLSSAYPQYRWQLMLLGLSGASLSMVMSAFATQPWHLVVTLGLIYPMSGLIYMPAAILLFEWFQQKRGLANGIMYAGTGAGGTVFPFIVQALLQAFGYKAAMISLGLGYFAVGAIAIPTLKPRIPAGRSRAIQSSLDPGERSHSRPKINWSFLRRSPIYAFAGSILLSSLGNFLPIVWIPTYAQDLGVNKPDGTTLLAIANAASVPGLLLLGYLSDHWPLRFVITLTCLGSAAACLLLWGFSTNSGVLIAFVVIFGLLGLSFSAIWSKLIGIIAKDDPSLPSIVFPIFAFMRGIGNITSGPVSEALLRAPAWSGAAGAYGFKNYGALLMYTGITMLAGFGAGIAYKDSD
ncbi:hypothetical protein NliqN6_3526 [Naganishia liquefaciens]|uniref:Major facilitator superfamily (MFS) profile domain-containing protein n=1 Tax=Naganishia liquefaciens TaxID=104408 RepID=A0A8H3TVU4_9TREE|nr:hypothetical protein NliqN6_3526 [Naganishia liquefaciens]